MRVRHHSLRLETHKIAIPKPGDPDIVYSGCKGRFGIYNRRTGSEQQYYVGFWNIYGHNPRDLAYRFQRVAPIHVSPHDPEQVYHASQFVHMTTDGGKTWVKVDAQPLGQFYTVNVDMAEPYNVYGGLQDNGTIRCSSANRWQTGANC